MWRRSYLMMSFSILSVLWPKMSTWLWVLFLLFNACVLIGPYYLWAIYSTFSRDAKSLARYFRLQWVMRRFRTRNLGLPAVFEETVAAHPEKIAIYFEDQAWTFRQLSQYSNRVANYFSSKGVQRGDCVSLYMSNRPEYVGVWLGLCKLGAVPALVNTNLRLASLKHCISIVNSTCVVVGAEFQSVFEEIQGDIAGMKVYIQGLSGEKLTYPGAIDMDAEAESSPSTQPEEMAGVRFADNMVYIFTSGTTGLPKAAVMRHSRAMFSAVGMFSMVGLSSDDVIYNPLPLNHTSGGVMTMGMCLVEGSSVVIKKKFSASKFWDDCIRHQCTCAVYIGELCRFLLNTPSKPQDVQHKVRVMFGNGLRAEIWEQFQLRFGIERICEFYGSTEGNTNVVNVEGKPGAVGFLSIVLPKFYPATLIKIDEETEEPVRDRNGICVKCQPGEQGEFVGLIKKGDPTREFHGYTDSKATAKKVVHDVWRKGDSAFLSGDILQMDERGYLFFKDRRGDTFRWKGENVSTMEVAGVVSNVAAMTDVTVYGVHVPGFEGRAGMAAILDPEKTVDLDELAAEVKRMLPVYARPLFVRVVKQSDLTATFKLKKFNLQKEGFDIEKTCDEIYWLDSNSGSYSRLDQQTYKKILNGELRL